MHSVENILWILIFGLFWAGSVGSDSPQWCLAVAMSHNSQSAMRSCPEATSSAQCAVGFSRLGAFDAFFYLKCFQFLFWWVNQDVTPSSPGTPVFSLTTFVKKEKYKLTQKSFRISSDLFTEKEKLWLFFHIFDTTKRKNSSTHNQGFPSILSWYLISSMIFFQMWVNTAEKKKIKEKYPKSSENISMWGNSGKNNFMGRCAHSLIRLTIQWIWDKLKVNMTSRSFEQQALTTELAYSPRSMAQAPSFTHGFLMKPNYSLYLEFSCLIAETRMEKDSKMKSRSLA